MPEAIPGHVYSNEHRQCSCDWKPDPDGVGFRVQWDWHLQAFRKAPEEMNLTAEQKIRQRALELSVERYGGFHIEGHPVSMGYLTERAKEFETYIKEGKK